MGKRLDCRKTGLDCDYMACGQTEEETLQKLGKHIQAFHGERGFSKRFYGKALAHLQEGSCDQPKDCLGGVCRL
jgi:predicted small metal-binding protein